MKAFVLSDFFASDAYQMTHGVILRENLQEAAEAVHAEIMMRCGNGANVRIPRYYIPTLNIPSLTYRLHTGERADESFVFCLKLFEVPLIPSATAP